MSEQLGTVPDEVLQNFLGKAKAVLAREEGPEYARYGPAFAGEFGDLDTKTLVLGTMGVFVDFLQESHNTYVRDFEQMQRMLCLADSESAVTKELTRVAEKTYRAAERRIKAQARGIQRVAEEFSRPKFAEGLEESLSFPWDKIPEIHHQTRAAYKAQKLREAADKESEAEDDAGEGEDASVDLPPEAECGGAEGSGCSGE